MSSADSVEFRKGKRTARTCLINVHVRNEPNLQTVSAYSSRHLLQLMNIGDQRTQHCSRASRIGVAAHVKSVSRSGRECKRRRRNKTGQASERGEHAQDDSKSQDRAVV